MDGTLQQAIASEAPEIAFRAGPLTFPMVRINPGDFMMGSPDDEAGHEANEPRRPVRITRPFYLAKLQVTQGQYEVVMGHNPSPKKNPAVAADQIVFLHALEFCKRIAANTGATATLPTEAQWEFACRAGTQTRFYTGSTEADLAKAAWYKANSGGQPHPPGQKEPNAWGLHDMLGNVWEFCSDFIKAPTTRTAVDLVGAQGGVGAIRGGGWMNDAPMCRAARRSMSSDMFGGTGIRLALTI